MCEETRGWRGAERRGKEEGGEEEKTGGASAGEFSAVVVEVSGNSVVGTPAPSDRFAAGSNVDAVSASASSASLNRLVSLVACSAAAARLVRVAAALAFDAHGRAMSTEDVITALGPAFRKAFPGID